MYAAPAPSPFRLDPDRDARAMESLAAAINRLADLLTPPSAHRPPVDR